MQVLSIQEILKKLIKEASTNSLKSEEDLHKLKKKYARDYQISLPTNFNLQSTYGVMIKEGWKGDLPLQRLMRKRKVRTISGVSIITVLTKPYLCPGKCVFCPTEPNMPKSYLSNEPGAMRAVLDNFDPLKQVTTRIDSLKKQGHETDKIEMIVLGGTFSAYDNKYRTEFIKSLYDACNKKSSKDIFESQNINEIAKNRIIGLSLETRPDHINEAEVQFMRELGCTKVQIGVQHLDNKVLELNKRGEKIEDSIHAIKLMKDAGLKIAAHLMPNLPGSSPEMDIKMLNDFFSIPDFKADQLKIYPCVVTPYSELETWWKEGKYKSYDDETLIKILVEIKKNIPEYVRIERLFRDIPGESILSGSQKTNMRQLLEEIMKKEAVRCRCIRCREIKGEPFIRNDLDLQTMEYDASEGKEFFISFNDTKKDKLCSLLRLRFHSYSLHNKKHYIKELDGATIIREVHTYGYEVKIGKSSKTASQHSGLGKQMLDEAEKISKKNGFEKIAVISGIGTRNYYRKWGYELEGTYMTKRL